MVFGLIMLFAFLLIPKRANLSLTDYELDFYLIFSTICLMFSVLITWSMVVKEPNYINYGEINDYKLEVIKDCNSNLTEREVKIIADNIGIIDYMPLFLDYRAKKNAEFEEKRRLEIKSQKKAEREIRKAERIQRKKDKELLNNFLSKKCNQGDEKC